MHLNWIIIKSDESWFEEEGNDITDHQFNCWWNGVTVNVSGLEDRDAMWLFVIHCLFTAHCNCSNAKVYIPSWKELKLIKMNDDDTNQPMDAPNVKAWSTSTSTWMSTRTQRQDHVRSPYLYPTHSGTFRLMKHRFICRNDVVLISVFLCESTTAPSNRAPRPNLDCFFSIYVCFGFLRFLFIFSLSMFVQCPSVDLLMSSRFAFTIIWHRLHEVLGGDAIMSAGLHKLCWFPPYLTTLCR